MSRKAKLRVCASCEWIFNKFYSCPKCKFGSYSAHLVYGNKCYEYAKTQEPWKERILTKISENLDKIIERECSDGK